MASNAKTPSTVGAVKGARPGAVGAAPGHVSNVNFSTANEWRRLYYRRKSSIRQDEMNGGFLNVASYHYRERN